MTGVLRIFALLLVVTAWPHAGLAAKTHALLIGSGDYRSEDIKDLEGPANDLKAMQALVSEIGAHRIIVLQDAQATRSAIEQAMFDLGRDAAPGDWVLLYYSGHGSQAVMPGASKPRVLQFVPLSGFDPDRQDPEHFIVDKDFYAWMKLYVPPEVNILMMVDSCHSGSMQRSIKPQLYGYVARTTLNRNGRPIELVARPGPRFGSLTGVAADDAELEPEDLPNLVYFGASRDGQLALEMQLPVAGGESRGLLTYAFEQGLTRPGSRADRPAADLDNDGVVSVEEIAAYLNGQVHLLSAYRQDSTATFGSAFGSVAVLSRARPTLKPASQTTPSLQIIPRPEPGGIAPEQALRLASEDEPADFRWDRSSGNLYRRSGDLVAEDLLSLAEVAGTLEKWQAIAALSPLAAERAIRLTLAPNGFDWLHEPGSRIAVRLERLPGWRERTIYATVFNIAADGTVQLIYPLAGEDGKLDHVSVDRDVLELEVTAPFGTDHLIAVMTDRPAEYLQAALRAADQTRAPARIIQPLQFELQQAGAAGALTIFELYTGK